MTDSSAFPSTKLFGNRFKKRASGGGKGIFLIVVFKRPFCANKHSKFCDYASFLRAQGTQDYISSKGELRKTRIISSNRGYLVKFEFTTLLFSISCLKYFIMAYMCFNCLCFSTKTPI